jgi:hypothetical protein
VLLEELQMTRSVVDEIRPKAELAVAPWPDPVIDRIGHDPRSSYVERFWLSILGPSTTFLLRRLATWLDSEPEGFVLDLPQTARSIGLGERSRAGKQSPFLRAISRTCQFGLARYDDETLVVRRRVPPLTHRQVERLPDGLRVEHDRWQRQQLDPAWVEDMRKRARRLALTLVELGEDFESAERQLHHWRFHPAVAFEAVTWAHANRSSDSSA